MWLKIKYLIYYSVFLTTGQKINNRINLGESLLHFYFKKHIGLFPIF
jgi:hypothetical protein